MKRKRLSANDIIKKYKKGERDFSRIECIGGWLAGVNLSGSSFRKADLSFTSFQGSNLKGCDFSGADLTWTNFVNADLTKASMRKTKLSFSKLNNAIFEGADLSGADLSYTLLFNVNLSAAKLDGTILSSAAFDISQMREEEHEFVMRELERSGQILPRGLFRGIRFRSIQIMEKARSVKAISKIITTYTRVRDKVGEFFGYSKPSEYVSPTTGYSRRTVYTRSGYGLKKKLKKEQVYKQFY